MSSTGGGGSESSCTFFSDQSNNVLQDLYFSANKPQYILNILANIQKKTLCL